MTDPRRRIPGVGRLLEHPDVRESLEKWPRERVVELLRRVVRDVRRALDREAGDATGGEPAFAPPADPEDPAWYAGELRRRLGGLERPSLRRVINATGVVLHTNLGRAPLASEAREAMREAATGYSNLEFDLDSGGRGSRYDHCVDLIRELTGAEDGLVVNNCAAGLVLALDALARGGRVLVSRGELVEIGGGFRIPDILGRSGARLVEVGSTNRTRIDDYRGAAEEGVALLLKVHRSNFRITGFTEEVEPRGLAGLAAELGVPLVHDLGTGLLVDAGELGLPPEPTPRDVLTSGADLVSFSGDKLLGGPQAGLLAGRGDLVARLRESPLCRALRVDKVTLAGLEATLRLYLDPADALERIPALIALRRTEDEIHSRAEALREELAREGVEARVSRESGRVGGGTYPGVELPTHCVRLAPPVGAEDFARALRSGRPAVVARLEGGEVLLDPRTVDPAETGALVDAVRAASAAAAGASEESAPRGGIVE